MIVATAHNHHLPFAVAIALLVPVLGGAIRAASLRSANFEKWDSRVRITHAGLTQKATEMLLDLQTRIVVDLGASDDDSGGPPQVSADPGPIIRLAERAARVLRIRDRLKARFRRYCRLHRPLAVAVALYLVGWVLVLLHYTAHVGPFVLAPVGIVLASAGILVGAGVFGAYAFLESKLAAAEELAAEES